jgi:hypothetical protein
MDSMFVFRIVVTVLLAMGIVFVLVRPFLLPERSLVPGRKNNEELALLDKAKNKEIVLDSLEELELARQGGLLSEEEYLEQKELLLKDATGLLR